MTASELQRIALRLSNQGWCRHFLHWRYPCQDQWLMAIQFAEMDERGRLRVATFKPLEAKGFRVVHEGIGLMYVIERTDEEGKPFRSRI